MAMYYWELKNENKDEIVKDWSDSLDKMIEEMIKINNQLWKRKLKKNNKKEWNQINWQENYIKEKEKAQKDSIN